LPEAENIGRTWPAGNPVTPKNQEFTMTDETNQESTPAPTEETTSHAPTPTTPWHKGMASPNPRGRPKQPKTVKEVKELAKQYTHQMVEVLSRVALNPKSPPAARTAAALGLLDRAWGKPQGDFEGGEQLIIKILKLNELEPEPEMKTIEGTVEHDDKDGA
jgi:hypothetical protein